MATTFQARDGNRIAGQFFAQVFQSYMECSDEVQQAIREMTQIVNADDATEEDREAALSTMVEALFPTKHEWELGVDLEQSDLAGENKETLDKMHKQEATFAKRLSTALKDKGMTQADLAKRVGVGQPAISMILNRDCRPQRRTVEKIAKAIGVPVAELWPE